MTATTHDRIQLLAPACRADGFVRLMGGVSADDLARWVAAELGRADALDVFAPHCKLLTKAYAPGRLLHIVSGNTPHAALQSLLRGLLLGSRNTVKTPSGGLPELEQWIASLPGPLRDMVDCRGALTEADWESADAVIAVGSDETIASVHAQLRPQQIFIPHGHKVSIGVVTGDLGAAARLAAEDASLFNQRGCLSPHAIYVQGDARAFAASLAEEMERFARKHPPEPLTLSEAGAVQNLRQTMRFIAANDGESRLWCSSGNLHWTVVYEPSATLKLSCLNRCVYVKKLPEPVTAEALGAEARHLSTVALHPFSGAGAEALASLPAHRVCPLGKSQRPDLFWHHDGFAPLASLVKWKDLG